MKKSLFLTSAIMTAVLAVGLSTSTYAWYSTTIGSAVSAKTTISATANNVQGEYNLPMPTVSKVNTTDKTKWTAVPGSTDANKTFTSNLGDETVIAADYGKADLGDVEGTHWYTAYVDKNNAGKTTLDTSTKGIYALKYTYTIPANNTVIKDNYKVAINFSITNDDVNVPWVFEVRTSSDAVAVTKASLNDTKVYKGYYNIPATDDQTYDIVMWINGPKVGADAGQFNIADQESNISLTLSVVHNTVEAGFALN
ncbi:MAG: hypothetical protein PUA56_02670 [Bacillales bacterium]|nr:hypothetical protein [Bacillales bacterium]